jgi:hypothetical protein
MFTRSEIAGCRAPVYPNYMMEKPLTGRPVRLGTDSKSVGRRLRQLLQILGISQADLCRDLSLKANRVSQWLSGDRMIPVDEAIEVCFAYGVTLDWIYRDHLDGMPFDLARKLRGAPVIQLKRAKH